MTEISIFRTSFIWVQTVPGILARTVPPPYSFVGARGDYIAAFDQCQAGVPAAGTLTLPWRKPVGNLYWRYYFEGEEAGTVTGTQAWKKLVPFRRPVDIATVSTPVPGTKVTFEAFYAPQGLALVARVNYRGAPKAPDDAADLALAARYDFRFLLGGETAPAGGDRLDTIAERALAQIRNAELGGPKAFLGGKPVSITTVLQGADVQPIAQGSDEHLLLETITSWKQGLKAADLAAAKLDEAKVPASNTDAENLVYGRDRGRAIWFPRRFVGNDESALRCYHDNLVQASLQVQSLGAFVTWVAGELENATVEKPVLERARRAAQLLEIFAGGKKALYRSASVMKQIGDADWADAIKVCKALVL